MSLPSRIVLSLAATLLQASIAAAADQDPPLYVEDAPEVSIESISGWYLRGDIGNVFGTRLDDVDYRIFDSGSGSFDEASFASGDLHSALSWGLGLGYGFNEWIRTDLTVDAFRASFEGTMSSPLPCLPAYPGTSCRSADRSDMSAVSVMANAYVDFGTIVGITPYLGAGIGASFVSWDRLDSRLRCVEGVNGCPDDSISGVRYDGRSGWRLTYALMAGLAYDLSDDFKLDVGYRYRHIEGGEMSGWDIVAASAGATGIRGSHGDIDQHEVRIGLRYQIR